MKQYLVISVMLLVANASSAATTSVRPLQLPFSLPTPAITESMLQKPFVCPEAPALPQDQLYESPWNANYTVLDAAKNAKVKLARTPIDLALFRLNRMLDAYTQPVNVNDKVYVNAQISDCALSWLGAWAKTNALGGKVTKPTGYDSRQFQLTNLAMAYNIAMRWRPESANPNAAETKAWLKRLLAEHKATQDYRIGVDKINNHLYWTAFAALNVAIATQDRELFDWGVRATQIGIGKISKAGYLDTETRREQLALNYSAFALDALTLNIWIARGNGVRTLSPYSGNLPALVHNVLAGMYNQEALKKEVLRVTGKNVNIALPFGKLAFAEPYFAMTGKTNSSSGKLLQAYLKAQRPITVVWPGQNLTELLKFDWNIQKNPL